MKTSQLRILGLALMLLSAGSLHALELFECVRDLLPITPHADFQAKRKGVEPPFMASPGFMVFPEVRDKAITGFFVYSAKHASYYEAPSGEGSYDLVLQPLGLETITIPFSPTLGRVQFHQRVPAASKPAGPRRLTHLTAQTSRSDEEMWRPLRDEMIVRRAWVQSHNLTLEPFRILTRIMDTTCKP